MAERTLEWSHIAPTCPDTLCTFARVASCFCRSPSFSHPGCYPFSDRDPFILQQTPHVYFVGNQPKFETRLIEGEDGQRTRIILVPKFSRTGEVVLVNSATLECRVVVLGE